MIAVSLTKLKNKCDKLTGGDSAFAAVAQAEREFENCITASIAPDLLGKEIRVAQADSKWNVLITK